MINIKEDKPQKIPGITSLFLKIKPFNKDVGEIIKENVDPYYYDKANKVYEVPLKNVNVLIDKLSDIEDIEIFGYKEPNTKPILYVNKDSFKYKLFDHQVDAINFGCNHDKWLLLDDMGLGKTLSAIYLAEELHRQGKIEHCMIICGIDSLRSNWKNEIEKFSDLSCMILGESLTRNGNIKYKSVTERAVQLKNKIDEFFIITTLTTIRSDDFVAAFNTSENNIGMIVVDEAHRCKDVGSLQGKNLIQLKAPYKVAMSGTIVVNNPLDLYAPFVFIGQAQDKSIEMFKKYYCQYNSNIGAYDGFRNLDTLKEQLDSCSLRRLKTDVLDLPEKLIIPQFLSMDDKQSKFYKDVVSGVKESVDLVSLSNKNLLGKIVRLRQATSCPQIMTSQEIRSIKVDRCVEMVNDLVGVKNEKLVIFTGFKDVVDQLSHLLKEYNPIVLTGDTKLSDFEKGKYDFQNNDDCKLLIATYQKLGTGVTLNKARYLIFIDTPWTSSDFNQACDRVHRIGSDRTVFIYNLICNGTIDNVVWELVNFKQALSDYIVDDKIENDKAMQRLAKYIQDL